MTSPEVPFILESIRFGSTAESARGIYEWLKRHDPSVLVRLDLDENGSSCTVTSASGQFELAPGDYIVIPEGETSFTKLTEEQFLSAFGEARAQPVLEPVDE